jgi:hypothetical protein
MVPLHNFHFLTRNYFVFQNKVMSSPLHNMLKIYLLLSPGFSKVQGGADANREVIAAVSSDMQLALAPCRGTG